MLLAASGVERVDHAVADAAGGERGKRATVGSPREDRPEDSDARLLRDVFTVNAARQAHPAERRLDQRLVAQQELFSSAVVTALRCRPQFALGKRGDTARRNGGSHARARCARR